MIYLASTCGDFGLSCCFCCWFLSLSRDDNDDFDFDTILCCAMFPWFRVINQNKTLSLELFSLPSWLLLLLILLPANRFQVYVPARRRRRRRNNNKNWHRVAGVAHKILLQNFAGKSAGNIRKMIRASANVKCEINVAAAPPCQP